MNLLDNKELLRGLLKQGDLVNTVNGGSIMPTSEVQNTEQGIIIKLIAPSIPVESLRILLDKNMLNIYSTIKTTNYNEDIHFPLFVRTFDVPPIIDTNKIEAYFEEGEISVLMPYKDKNSMQRFISVKAA